MSITCLLDDVTPGVQVPYWEPLQEVAARFFFGGAGLRNHEPRTMEIAAALFVLRRVFLSVLRWQMRCLWKPHDPRYQLVWSAADRAANNVANMAASLAPSNLRRDSKAPRNAK